MGPNARLPQDTDAVINILGEFVLIALQNSNFFHGIYSDASDRQRF